MQLAVSTRILLYNERNLEFRNKLVLSLGTSLIWRWDQGLRQASEERVPRGGSDKGWQQKAL